MSELVPNCLLAKVANEDIGEHGKADDKDQESRHVETQSKNRFDLTESDRRQYARDHRDPDPEDEEDDRVLAPKDRLHNVFGTHMGEIVRQNGGEGMLDRMPVLRPHKPADPYGERYFESKDQWDNQIRTIDIEHLECDGACHPGQDRQDYQKQEGLRAEEPQPPDFQPAIIHEF